MNQKGFAPLFILLGFILIVGIASGSYYLGKTSNKPSAIQADQDIPNRSSPTIATISAPQDITQWVLYKSKVLNIEFKLPPALADKYGQLVENETKGERGSELTISFVNDSKSLTIKAQSPEYTPPIPLPLVRSEEEKKSIMIYGPGISTPSVFQGFRFENDAYYGVQPFGQLRELPKEQVTQYRINGKDILKVKALYSDYGSTKGQIYPENPPKIWGVIIGTGNTVYSGFTVQGILSQKLTEHIFEQILSTFKFTY